MPIISILEQPASSTLNTSYRPIVFRVSATRTDGNPEPPVVYCDVYINSVYYKTISKTQYYLLNGSNTEWYFDIQDVCQEVISKKIGANGGTSVLEFPELFVNVFCKFRSSGLDSNGFIVSDGLEPIQRTGKVEPVSGDGTSSNSFYSLAIILKHSDNQNLESHLSFFKTGTWAASCFPLSHRRDGYRVCLSDSDYFPFFNKNSQVDCIRINYRYTRNGSYSQSSTCGLGICVPVTLTAPTLPDAEVGFDYEVIVDIDGTGPFTLTGIVKPSWMTIEIINGNQVSITGNPSSTASNVDVAFTVNGCNGSFYDFADVIDVTECVAVTFTSSTTLPDADAGIYYSFFIDLGGTAPFVLTSVTKPAWMSVAIEGSQLHLSGNNPDEATGEVVQVTVGNCEGSGSVLLDTTIDTVNTSVRYGTRTILFEDSLNIEEERIIFGPAGTIVTLKVTEDTNTNGGHIYCNGIERHLNDTFNVTLPATINVEINMNATPGVIRQTYSIDSIDTGIIGSPSSYQVSKIII